MTTGPAMAAVAEPHTSTNASKILIALLPFPMPFGHPISGSLARRSIEMGCRHVIRTKLYAIRMPARRKFSLTDMLSRWHPDVVSEKLKG